MSKYFYKDIKVLRFCKKCKMDYKPVRGSFFASLGLCHKHRNLAYDEWYEKRKKPYLARMTPSERAEYDRKQHRVWMIWVKKNVEKRRRQSLASYHRNKDKHKDRKHRATKTQAG